MVYVQRVMFNFTHLILLYLSLHLRILFLNLSLCFTCIASWTIVTLTGTWTYFRFLRESWTGKSLFGSSGNVCAHNFFHSSSSTFVKHIVLIQIANCSGDEDSVIPLLGSRTLVKELAEDLNFNTTVPYGAWFHKGQVCSQKICFALLNFEHSFFFSLVRFIWLLIWCCWKYTRFYLVGSFRIKGRKVWK